MTTCVVTGVGYEFQEIRPRIRCKDGYTVSIQASSGAYCDPRVNNCNGAYKEVELGYPSRQDDDLLDYAEDPDSPTGTVYGYVPVYKVQQVCEKHGGIIDVDLSNISITTTTDEWMDMLCRLRKELRKEQ